MAGDISALIATLVVWTLWVLFLWYCPRRPQMEPPSAKTATLQRLLKPRTPDDCPACRRHDVLPQAAPAPPRPRPWCQVKSRRGAPKRIATDGFACLNAACLYYRITDATVHALVGDGTHGTHEHIQTFRCQACRRTFTSRRDTPLYRLKTASSRVAEVLSALAEGLSVAAAVRVFGHGEQTITTWLTRAGEHSATLHDRWFRHLHLPHLQLDELRTRLRNRVHVLWLWGRPRSVHQTHPGAPAWHADANCGPCRRARAPSALGSRLPSGLHERWAEPVLLRLNRPFRSMGRNSWPARPPLAGGGWLDLWASQEDLPTTEGGPRNAGDATGDARGTPGGTPPTGAERPVEHSVH